MEEELPKNWILFNDRFNRPDILIADKFIKVNQMFDRDCINVRAKAKSFSGLIIDLGAVISINGKTYNLNTIDDIREVNLAIYNDDMNKILDTIN